jgi:hypothetical protein
MSKDKDSGYLSKAGWAVLVVVLAKTFWPEAIPFETFAPWRMMGTLGDWLGAGLPFLLWGVATTLFFNVIRNGGILRNLAGSSWSILKIGAGVSLQAGVFEEIVFRWLIFYAAIVGIKIVDFLIFGFAGFGLEHAVHMHVLGPLADHATLGNLHYWLSNPEYWAVGAAIVSTSVLFRDGHAYLGWFGWFNSWFMSMAFFWFMFTFGLPSAVLIHFLYDFVIFGTIALVIKIRD